MTEKVLFEDAAGVFLDVKSVGSSVRYSVMLAEYGGEGEKTWLSTHANVSLSDCSRVIDWDISGKNGLEKLDRAIAMLRKCRADLRLLHKKKAAYYRDNPDKKVREMSE